MSERTVWAIHGGRRGEAHSLFLGENVVALDWHQMGNLGKLAANRDAFKERVSSTQPDWSRGRVIQIASQLYRFVHEMRDGDIVVYPSKLDRQIHIGKITGPYEYRPEIDQTYPNSRAVKWLKHILRTGLSQGAIYEARSALSFSQINHHADEFLSALNRKNEHSGDP